MVKVTCEIDDYSEPSRQHIRMHNHWRGGTLIEIEINGERYSVDGNDLKTAADNCMNTGV